MYKVVPWSLDLDLSEFYKLVEDSDNIFMENVLSFLVGYNV